MSIKKRGQLNANVLIYITSIILVGVILVIGYKYFFSAKESMSKTDLVFFKNKIASDIMTISSDYGSSKTVSYSLPGSAELCFFDLERKDEIVDNIPENFNPLVKDSIKSGIEKNTFIMGKSIFESYYIGDIRVNSPYFICFKPIAGEVSFIIEGLGDRALILEG